MVFTKLSEEVKAFGKDMDVGAQPLSPPSELLLFLHFLGIMYVGGKVILKKIFNKSKLLYWKESYLRYSYQNIKLLGALTSVLLARSSK